jgi:hypothetical protein
MTARTPITGGAIAMATLGIKSQAELGGRLREIARIAADEAAARDAADALARRKRRRSTIRQMMFLVAFWAVILGGWRHYWWNAYCTERAQYHAGLEAFHRNPQAVRMSAARAGRSRARFKPRPDLVAYHYQMRLKWERAAAQPWLSVEPDPPPP